MNPQPPPNVRMTALINALAVTSLSSQTDDA